MTIDEAMSEGIEDERNGEQKNLEYPHWAIDVSFVNAEGLIEEMQFEVKNLSNIEELNKLWKGFCKENGFSHNSITGITIVG